MNENTAPDLLKVVRLSIALGFGGLAGFIASIREVNPHVHFVFDWVVALAIGFGVYFGLLLCRTFLTSTEETEQADEKRRKGRMIKLTFFGLLPCGAILMGLIFLVRGASTSRQLDYFVGFAGAVVFLTVLGWVLYRILGFFEQNSEDSLDDAHR